MVRGAEGQEGYKCGVGNISRRCYSITKLIYFWVLRGLLYNTADSRAVRKLHGPLGAMYAMTCSRAYAMTCSRAYAMTCSRAYAMTCSHASADARDRSGSRDTT